MPALPVIRHAESAHDFIDDARLEALLELPPPDADGAR